MMGQILRIWQSLTRLTGSFCPVKAVSLIRQVDVDGWPALLPQKATLELIARK